LFAIIVAIIVIFLINKSKKMKKNKAQHEIAGFVLIVLVVTVIGVVFFGIMFAKGNEPEYNSVEISKLLEASMYYTTDCAIKRVPQYSNIQELIRECWERGDEVRCLVDGKGVCIALETTLENIINKSLEIGEENPNKAYKLDIYFSSEDIPDEEVLSLSKGEFSNCSSVVGGWHGVNVGLINEDIRVDLLVCEG